MSRVFGRIFLAAIFLILMATGGQAASGNQTMKLKDVTIGKVVQVGNTKFVKVGDNQYLTVSPTLQLWSNNRQESVLVINSGGCLHPEGVLQEFSADQCNVLSISNNTTIGDTVCLMDERDGKTYSVRRFPDGHCWLAQNLRFGVCNATDFSTTNTSVVGFVGSYQNTVYRGRCRQYTYKDMYDGYYYDWEAAMNNQTAVYGATYDQRLNGSTMETHDICPLGWHVPSSSEWAYILSKSGHFYNLRNNAWNVTQFSPYAGRANGTGFAYTGSSGYMASSTAQSTENVYTFHIHSGVNVHSYPKSNGLQVRCMLDY